MHRGDLLAILLVWSLSVWLSLFVTPHTGYESRAELFYYAAYNVAVGAFIGLWLFDRLHRSGLALFAMRAAAVLLTGTLINETLVEPVAFAAGPINGEGFYYGVSDALWTAVSFVLLRVASWLRSGRRTDRGAVPQPVQDAVPNEARADEADAACLFVRAGGATRRIQGRDILYLQAERDFTRIVCVGGKHFASESLKSLLERSAGLGLVRIHKSYAVNLARVERLARAQAQLGEQLVPVGRRYRAAFAETWRSRAPALPPGRSGL